MTTVNIYEAKTNLSKLIKRVQQGEEIAIANNGVPIVDLTLHKPKKQSLKIGMWADQSAGYIDEDIVGPDLEIIQAFADSVNKPL